MRRLGLLLCLALLARAGDDPLVHVYDVADLKENETAWAIVVARLKVAAAGVETRLEKNNLVVVAPSAVQETIAKELRVVRDAFGKLVTLEVRLVKVEGGLGVASVPVDKLDALLKEKRAETITGPCLTCFDGQKANLSVVRQVSYVSDFEVTLDGQGNVTVDPVVSIVADGVMVNFRPLISGQVIRIATEVTVSEVKDQMPEVELPLPLPTAVKIQVPEVKTRSVARLVECAPGAHSVIDVGDGRILLLRAIPARLPANALAFDGQDIELK
jgi:hypothetical protein